MNILHHGKQIFFRNHTHIIDPLYSIDLTPLEIYTKIHTYRFKLIDSICGLLNSDL